MKKASILATLCLTCLSATASAASVGYSDLTSEQQAGVVLAWDFDNNSGAPTYKDSTGGFSVGNNFSVTSGYAHQSGNPATPQPWSNSTGTVITGSFTLSFDLNRMQTNANWRTLLTLSSSTSIADANSMQLTNNGDTIQLCTNIGGAANYGSGPNFSISTGLERNKDLGWTTLTIVSDVDNKQLTLYVNGESVGSVDNWEAGTGSSLALKGFNFMTAGGDARALGSDGYGEFDNITLWNKALSAAEVGSLIKSVPEPATATLSLLALAGLAARRRRK